MSRYKISAVDQMRVRDRALVIGGPVGVISSSDLRSALIEIARIGPQTRFGLRADSSRRRWLFDPDAVGAAVEEVPPTDAADISRFATAVFNSDLTHSSIRIVASGEYVACLGSHGISDGIGGSRLWAALVSTAQSGQLPSSLHTAESRLPLSRTIIRSFAADPRRLGAAVRWHSHVRGTRIEAVSATRRTPWRPNPVSLSLPMDPQVARRLVCWRDEHAPSASLRAITLFVFLAALRGHGVETASNALVLMDARRYAHPSTVVNGNFAVGQYVPVGESVTLSEVSRGIAGALVSGHPLLTLSAISAKATVASVLGRSHATVAEASVGIKPHAFVSYSDIGRLPNSDEIRWTGDQLCVAATDPYGAEGIAFLGAEIDGRRHLSVTFHSNVFDTETIKGVLRAVACDPTALLDECL